MLLTFILDGALETVMFIQDYLLERLIESHVWELVHHH